METSMPPKIKPVDARTEQGRELARRLYDYKISQLEQISAAEKASLMSEFPKLAELEFQYVVQQLISAKRLEQQRIGWQAIPHDVTVLILVLVTTVVGLPAGIVSGVFALVLLESFFQFQFDERLYQYLSLLVWITYPAYIWLAYFLYRQGYQLIWVAVIVLLTWGGTYLLGVLARIPSRLFFEAQTKSAADAANRKKKENAKK
jgi:hypothetical protein